MPIEHLEVGDRVVYSVEHGVHQYTMYGQLVTIFDKYSGLVRLDNFGERVVDLDCLDYDSIKAEERQVFMRWVGSL